MQCPTKGDTSKGVQAGRGASRTRRETRVLANYLPTLLFLIVATGIGIALILAGRFLGPRALVTMGLFVGMLFLGFIYVWKKGALEWE